MTVGSFDSPNDPQIKKYLEKFGARLTVGKDGKQSIHYKYVPVRENKNVLNFLPLDPAPQLMAVPRM